FEAAPVQALDVEARHRPDVGLLADWPHLARVRRLEFPRGRLGIDGVTLLGNSPHAAGLTELAFEFDGITDEGVYALAESALFPRLVALELRSNVIPPDVLIDALRAARRPGSLARLSLAGSQI